MQPPDPGASERRWWIGAVVWTAALYLGTALAQQIMLALRGRGLLTHSVTAAFVLAGIVALVLVVRAGGRARTLAVAAAFALVYVTILRGMPIVQERLHFIQFGVLALLSMRALELRALRLGPGSWWRRHPELGGIVIGSLGGFGDELVQAVVPSRVFDWRDVGFNAAAALLAIAAARTLRTAIARDREPQAR